MGEPEQPEALAAILTEWKKSEKLVSQAAKGLMAIVGKGNDLDRQEVCQNKHILLPIVAHLGTLTAFVF